MYKMMDFEFANNVFSGMLSLFAAVIGLAYPFILQVVERIRNLYVTEKVVDWFQQEKTLCHFLLLLKANIPLAILIPYLLFIFNDSACISITLLTIQSAFVCALLCYLMRMYRLVNIYSSYIKMANYTRREDIERLAIVMLSADHKNEEEGYTMARDKLYERITEILVKEAQKRGGLLVEYPAEVVQIIGKILTAAREKGKYPRTSLDTSSIPHLYDAIFNKAHPSKDLRKFIWYHLNTLLKAGNTEWLKSYWEWASQFYRTMRYDQNYSNTEREDFHEMHTFFAAMVLRSKNRELMKHIMTYNNASPEPPCLLLSRFDTIIGTLLKYDKARHWPYKLAEPYQMYFFASDVNADDNIFRVLCDYLALSLLYITVRKNAYSTYNDDYQISAQTSKEELERDEKTLKWFREIVLDGMRNVWRRNFTKEELVKTNGRILRLIESYNDRIEKITENDNISPQKLQAMKDGIIGENKKIQLPFTKGKMEGEEVETLSFIAHGVANASPGQLMEHQNISSVNFGSTLIIYLRHQFYAHFARIFILNSSVRTFLVQYKDLPKALRLLNFSNDEHLLLNNGVSLWRYDLEVVKEENIIDMGSGNDNLFIVKKKDCPTYTFGQLDDNLGYDKLDADNGLYWKEPTKGNSLAVNVAQPYIIYNRRHTRYIKINITYDRALGDCSLHKLKDIRDIL